MTTVNMHEAKTNLSSLVAKVEAGEEVVISRDGTPVAKIVRVEPPAARFGFGSLKGQIWISPDFNEPDQEFIDAIENGPIDVPDKRKP
jgi:prevent-host-death family protein